MKDIGSKINNRFETWCNDIRFSTKIDIDLLIKDNFFSWTLYNELIEYLE